MQVFFAAVFEEVDDFFVLLHGLDDLGLFERARVVLVDHNKALPGSLRAGPSVTYAKASDAGSRAFRNSLVNLAISFAAALAWASRALARCASLFRSAVSIASSLRCYGPVSRETRRLSRGRGDGVRLRHQHAVAAARHRRVAAARHRRVEGAPKFQAPKRTTRPHRCSRRGPCPSAGAPTRDAPAPAGTGGSGCRS